jgi:hypothetical protein
MDATPAPSARFSTRAVALAVVAALVVLLGVAYVTTRPSRDERADSAARKVCQVMRQPFDHPNAKDDALPVGERVAKRHRELIATTATAAEAARLSPRWQTLYSAWKDFVADSDSVASFQVVRDECEKARAGKQTQHDIDCAVAREQFKYRPDCPGI